MPERWEGLELLGYWALLLGLITTLLFIAAGIVEIGKRILAVLWPWVQAHSDELIVGLSIVVVIGIFVALALENRQP